MPATQSGFPPTCPPPPHVPRVVVELGDETLHVSQGRGLLLADRVWGQAPLTLSQTHGAAGGVEADPNLPRRPDAVVQPVPDTTPGLWWMPHAMIYTEHAETKT